MHRQRIEETVVHRTPLPSREKMEMADTPLWAPLIKTCVMIWQPMYKAWPELELTCWSTCSNAGPLDTIKSLTLKIKNAAGGYRRWCGQFGAGHFFWGREFHESWTHICEIWVSSSALHSHMKLNPAHAAPWSLAVIGQSKWMSVEAGGNLEFANSKGLFQLVLTSSSSLLASEILSCFRIFHPTPSICRPHLNFLCGENGSGKTATLHGLQNCLGVSARNLDRMVRSEQWIKDGTNYNKASIVLWNTGENAIRPRKYGSKLTIRKEMRRTARSGVSTIWSILDEGGKEVIFSIDYSQNSQTVHARLEKDKAIPWVEMLHDVQTPAKSTFWISGLSSGWNWTTPSTPHVALTAPHWLPDL